MTDAERALLLLLAKERISELSDKMHPVDLSHIEFHERHFARAQQLVAAIKDVEAERA